LDKINLMDTLGVPNLVYLQKGNVQVNNPEITKAFYDELKGQSKDYFIDSNKDFDLYINLLVPGPENKDGIYSARIFSIKDDGKEEIIISTEVLSSYWSRFYEPFGRDYYLKGPELTQKLPAGKYKIEVFSDANQGKYVFVVGKDKVYGIQSILNAYWQLPLLKATFFKTSVLQFFFTPFGIVGAGAVGLLLILLALIYYLVGFVKKTIKHNEAKTLLLTSSGMQSMKNEISKLLQKPSYDVTVAFITTAAKPQEDLGYVKKDWDIMKEEMRFNVEEVDIEGKTESEVMRLLEIRDIIFVEGGNTFYLLKAMRACNFEKVIRKLLKQGKVYMGASAGSIVAGRTIKTAGWKNGDKNFVGLKDLRGLNLVPFDIFVHYQPEHAEIIKAEIKNPKKRAKNLKIITDEQAILVQGKDAMLIGKGDAIIV